MKRAIIVAPLVLSIATTLVALGFMRVNAQGGPVYTELEKARIENVNLLDELRQALADADTCHGLLAQPRQTANQQLVASKLALLKADIERDHPGYVWDPRTGTFSPAVAAPAGKP